MDHHQHMGEEVEAEVDLEWEEWDGSSSFLHHCIAGSIAGVAEHVLLYPVDTVKTHMQAYCSTCPNNPANIASPNAATKPICTGPPGSAVGSSVGSSVSSVFQHVNASAAKGVAGSASTSTASASASTAHGPHGMWSTMSNLINHGHSNYTASTVQIKHAARIRQSGTLTATATATLPHLEAAAATVPIKQNITKGYARLWRGVQTMATGCIPAHALYFSSYEYSKSILSTTTTSPTTGTSHVQLNTFGASIAGATSSLFHDLVMTPMDTVKQRMQLGHYEGMGHAIRQIVMLEGWAGLYRSFGVTVLTNLPYGMIMVSTNEFLRNGLLEMKREDQLKQMQQQQRQGGLNGHLNDINNNRPAVLDLQTTMFAGCGAGMVAAAVTSPLDRVKTRLQTQKLLHSMPPSSTSIHNGSTATTVECPKARAITKAAMDLHSPHYSGFSDALTSIIREEGYVGLWRGLVPRLLTHTPAVAISWTSYEAAKRFLHEYA